MQIYADKNALISEITKTASLFIGEFKEVLETDRDLRLESVDRTPGEILSYQLGWMDLIRSWDRDELDGKKAIMPAPGYKWNQLGGLYQSFYDKYQNQSLAQLQTMFKSAVEELITWIEAFHDDDLFQTSKREWAASTPSNWPVWKWIHINTVAPFKSFRGKIRKWKKLRLSI
jgi:hypothetical protein